MKQAFSCGVLAVFAAVGSVGTFSASAAGFTMKAPSSQNSISGRVASYDGKTALGVRTNAGRLVAVRLQDGTVISPRGVKLKRGMTVTVVGSRSGATFVALQVVAPLGRGNGSKLGNGSLGSADSTARTIRTSIRSITGRDSAESARAAPKSAARAPVAQ